MATTGVVFLGEGSIEIAPIILTGVDGTWGSLACILRGHSANGWTQPQSPHKGMKALGSILLG